MRFDFGRGRLVRAAWVHGCTCGAGARLAPAAACALWCHIERAYPARHDGRVSTGLERRDARGHRRHSGEPWQSVQSAPLSIPKSVPSTAVACTIQPCLITAQRLGSLSLLLSRLCQHPGRVWRGRPGKSWHVGALRPGGGTRSDVRPLYCVLRVRVPYHYQVPAPDPGALSAEVRAGWAREPE